jgi:DNA-binding NarL/FixJ family response regulator
MALNDHNRRVLLINEHRIVREAIRLMVDTSEGFEVAGEAGNATQALQLIDTVQPDVVATELPLPDRSGVRFVEELLERRPDAAILVLGGVTDVEHAMLTMRAGARGYIHKGTGRAGLLNALREVAAGRRYPCESFADSRRRTRELQNASGSPVNLTDRQVNVLRSIALGFQNKEIAHRLGVSVKAVQHHRARISDLLDLRGTAALTLYAVRAGLVAETACARIP